MDFNAVAPYYNSLKKIVFGRQLEGMSLHYIGQQSIRGRVLIVGGGNDNLLTYLLEHPGVQEIIFCELSAHFCQQVREQYREHPKWNRVTVENVDFFDWKLATTDYSHVIFPFFLDLFSQEQVDQCWDICEGILAPRGQVHVVDFSSAMVRRWWDRGVIYLMYLFFRPFIERVQSYTPTYVPSSNRGWVKLKQARLSAIVLGITMQKQ